MTKTNSFFEHLLTHYRGIFATVFLLPISFAYTAYNNLRNRWVFMMNSAPAKHGQRVQHVIAQIQAWQADGCKEKLCTARSGWKTMSEMVPKYKLTHRNIDVSLYDILEISTDKQTVKVEPLATMGQISGSLLSKGWTLAVVPELDTLTVGGLVMGFGVESSSHKYGLFQSICVSFDIVTAEGQCLHCSASENAGLFYLIPWSHGTLGFLVAAELKIIPAKKYVRVHYQPVYSLEDMATEFAAASRDISGNDFVEGLVYSRDTAVIMRGTLTDDIAPDSPLNAIGRWYKPWFYQHVATFLRHKQGAYETIPLRQYYHRHTRSYFWAMEEIIPFGNHPLFRALLGWALPPSIELLKYTETETTRKLREQFYVLQDMLVPMVHLKASIAYFDTHFNLYPLWLSPMAVYDNDQRLGFVHPCQQDSVVDEMYVDVGAYGTPHKANFDNRQALPLLEKFVLAHQGYQALYAKTMLSLEDFRTMFDHSAYDRLREQLPLCKQAFDEVYDKVSHKGRVSPIEMRKLQSKSEKVVTQ
ncbi:MAG: FAD-binding protein [Methylococcales bacterium]|nr:FAD-binding protein [Methylococcales bacterium]